MSDVVDQDRLDAMKADALRSREVISLIQSEYDDPDEAVPMLLALWITLTRDFAKAVACPRTTHCFTRRMRMRPKMDA